LNRKKMLTKRGKYRLTLTLDLSPGSYERLQGLEDLVGAENKSRLVREALRLYEFVARRHSEGSRFVVRDQDGKEETLVLLGVDA